MRTKKKRLEPNYEVMRQSAIVSLQTAWNQYVNEIRKEMLMFGIADNGKVYTLAHESHVNEMADGVRRAAMELNYINEVIARKEE